jgi:hypothetical protein
MCAASILYPECIALPQVHPGAEGRARFEAQIRELIQLEDGEDFDVEFECRAPDTGEELQLVL